MRIALALLLSLSACSATLTTLRSDEQKAIDCLKEAEPMAVENAKHIISATVNTGSPTKEEALSQLEQYAMDEVPAVVGCAAFAMSISSQGDASAVAAQYIANHNLTFTASPKDAGAQ